MKKKSKKPIAKKSAKKTAKKPAKKVNKKTAKKAIKKAAKKAVKVKAKKSSAKKVVKKVLKKTAKKASKKLTKKASLKKALKPQAQKAKPIVKKPAKKAKTKVPSAPKPVSSVPFKAHQSRLQVGDKAPYFEGIDQNGNRISLHDLAGKKVILYFYPKDDTPGCTATACSLRDEYAYLGQKNYAVVGVSADDGASHAKFAEKYQLPFPLLADTDKTILQAYDVWGKKMFMGKVFDGIIRTTFVISEDGTIEHVIHSVDTASHAQQILNL